MLFVEPIAVAHSPTVSWPAVAFPVFRYLVAVLTVTTSGPGLTVVVVLSAPVVVDVRPPTKARRVPFSRNGRPRHRCYLADCKSDGPGRPCNRRARSGAGAREGAAGATPKKPPPPKNPAPPPPPPKPRLQVPLVDEKIVTFVAFAAPAEPFEPVAVMHTPTFTSLRLAVRLAVMVVEAVRSTVV